MDKQEELKLLAQCLRDFLDLDPNPTNPYATLYFVADQTLKNIELGRHTSFNSAEIAKAVAKVKSEPSAWLSHIWKRINLELKPKHQQSLALFALKRGLEKYPWISKIESVGGAGNQAQYLISGHEIDRSIVIEPDRFSEIPFDIEYVAVKDLKPSLLARFIFNDQNSAVGWRKKLLIFHPVAEILFFGLFAALFLIYFWLGDKPVSTKDLVFVLLAYVSYRFIKYNAERFLNFVEDRVIMASEHFVRMDESNVVQELVTVNDDKGEFIHKKVQLVKYVSICKICGAQVVLEKGEPDFPRRIVGRCKESPREHVYTFDRVTKKGLRLR